MSLKLPDVPNLANPGLYQLLLALRQQMVTLGRQFDDLSAQAGGDVGIAPQFDNDTSLATTAWVQRFGHQYSSRIVVTGNTQLDASAAGGLIIIQAAAVVTLPPANSVPGGVAITFQVQIAGPTIQRLGTDVINMGNAVGPAIGLNQGDTLELVSNGATAWLAVGGAAQLPYSAIMSNWPLAAQFDHSGKLATTQFVQQAVGNRSWVYAFNANTVLAPVHAGTFIVCFGPMTTLTLPVSTTFTPGTSIDILAAAPLTVAAQGADLIHNGSASASTYAMAQGARRVLTYGYTNQWFSGA